MSRQFEDQWRNRFIEFAELHDDDARIAGWSVTGLEARVRRFRSLWQPGRAGEMWLDAGCGAGTYLRILAGHGNEVLGIDYSLPALRKALGRDRHSISLVVADVRRLPLRGGDFDGVLCFGVTQALAESGPAVRELARQVRSGGCIWIDALNRSCLVHIYERIRRRLARRSMHLHYESPRAIIRSLRLQGFSDVELYWMPIVPSRFHSMQRFVEAPAVQWLFSHVPLLGLLMSHAFIVRARRDAKSSREVS